MPPELSSAHQSTYQSIFRHPAAHNLQWRDVRSLLGVVASIVEEPGGNTRATLDGRTLVLHSERHKDVGTEEQLKELRAFLKGPGEPAAASIAQGVNLLVVIDHRGARIYKAELRGSVPERVVPYDPDGSGRHLHYVQDDSNGQRKPEQRSYYDAIAKSLHGADAILLFGGGTGASSAMEQLRAELALHHKDLAARIVGWVAVDDHHLSEDQLLAKARAFYADVAAARSATN